MKNYIYLRPEYVKNPKDVYENMKKKKKIGKLIVADSSDGNILYITGFRAPDKYIFFSVRNLKAIVVSAMEFKRACGEVKSNIKVYTYSHFSCNKRASLESILPKITAMYNIEEWEVPFDFPIGYAEILKAADINVKHTRSQFFPQRRKKTQEEINNIRRSLEIAEIGMAKAVDILKSAKIDRVTGNLSIYGHILTSENLIKEIESEIFKYNAIAIDTIVSCGRDASEPHNCGSGPIMANKPIVIDIFPRHKKTGYWGDITRTFVKGKPSEITEKAYSAVLKAKQSAIKTGKAGMRCAALYSHTCKVLKDCGFETSSKKNASGEREYKGFIHGLGHGVGLDIHELPTLSPSSKHKICEHDVFTIEPGLYYPEWGGIRLEDMVVVRNGRLRNITSFPHDFIL